MADDEPPRSEIVLYQTEDGRTRIECRFEDQTIWLTQALIAELFQTTPQNVTIHLKAIYEEGELNEAATCKDYLQVRQEGGREVSRKLRHYSLPAILAVGYRVRGTRGTQFRQWATARLTEYLVKGFTLDDERLKNPPGPGVPDHFDELLERIRDIRASEKRMYLRVREILALAADYSPTGAIPKSGYAAGRLDRFFAAGCVNSSASPSSAFNSAKHSSGIQRHSVLRSFAMAARVCFRISSHRPETTAALSWNTASALSSVQ